VNIWIAGAGENTEYVFYDACTEEPEVAWLAILEILKHELTEDQRSFLAARVRSKICFSITVQHSLIELKMKPNAIHASITYWVVYGAGRCPKRFGSELRGRERKFGKILNASHF
jgi:hypothetical protein